MVGSANITGSKDVVTVHINNVKEFTLHRLHNTKGEINGECKMKSKCSFGAVDSAAANNHESE